MINLGDREITRGSVNINTECHLFRMLSMYFISLSFMALYENALNQTGFKCGKPTKQTASLLISCGLMITLTSYLGLLLFRKIRLYTRTRVKQRRRLRSHYWTRRRIYWRRRNIYRELNILLKRYRAPSNSAYTVCRNHKRDRRRCLPNPAQIP